MALPTDALGTPQPPNRVYYSLGRMLGVEDFQADQDYHRGRLARALVQICGTGTVSGLNVTFPQIWQQNRPSAASAFVYDSNKNVQVNTGTSGTSGTNRPTFATALGGTISDGPNIVWTNEGPINPNGWQPSTPFTFPSAIIDSNGNIQILKGPATLTTGSNAPVWSTAIGIPTPDGANPAAWICVGPAQREIVVSPGLAIDRVGRMIEVPRTLCIRIEPWLANQSTVDLNNALVGSGTGNILVDVFASFVPCTRGVTPCFATQDDYDATDAFSPNRLLDSFAMQLVLRNDPNPQLPKDPWLFIGPAPTTAITPAIAQGLQQNILNANSVNVPAPVDYPVNFDTTSVFLARISIPATAGAAGQPPNFSLMTTTIDNLSRLFLYPASLVARSLGLSSGAES